jgi:D-hydroxyproline dehydrogenase subunit gamma
MTRRPVSGGVQRGQSVTVTVDGRPTSAYLGESVAAVLIAGGDLSTRTTVDGEPRGLFCGMGVCFDCLVIVDGVPGTRACVTWVRDGMRIAHQHGHGVSGPAAAADGHGHGG